MRLWVRTPEGTVSRDEDFFPFFFIKGDSYPSGFRSRYWSKRLDGSNEFNRICAFSSWQDLWEGVRSVLEQYQSSRKSGTVTWSECPDLLLRPDPVHQFMLQTGRSMYAGMSSSGLRRMQIDCIFTQGDETGGNGELALVSMSDSTGWGDVITPDHGTEESLLTRFAALIGERDPDIIEGAGGFHRTLARVVDRFDHHQLDCPIGRDASAPQVVNPRLPFAPDRSYQPDSVLVEIPGRRVIDYETTQELLALPDVRRFRPDAIFPAVTPGKRSARSTAKAAAALADLTAELRAVSDLLFPGLFTLLSMVPFPPGQALRSPLPVLLESLLLREYLRQRRSLPAPPSDLHQPGRQSVTHFTGLFRRVLHLEYRNLPAVVIASGRIAPANDEAGLVPILADELLSLRDQPGKVTPGGRDARSEIIRELLEALPTVLTSGRSIFADQSAAEQMRQSARAIMTATSSAARQLGASVIHAEAASCYCELPADYTGPDADHDFVGTLTGSAGAGVQGMTVTPYESMLVVKSDAFALLDTGGRIYLHGSSLLGRSLEDYNRRFVHSCIRAFLGGELSAVHDVYRSAWNAVSGKKLSVADFARTETLRDSYEEYTSEVAAGSRERSPAYEAVLRARRRWSPGERVSWYVTGTGTGESEAEMAALAEEWDPNRRDENMQWYLGRLAETAKRFEGLMAPELSHSVFSESESLGLYGTSAGVRREQLTGKASDDAGDSPAPSPRIWIDPQPE